MVEGCGVDGDIPWYGIRCTGDGGLDFEILNNSSSEREIRDGK